MCLGEDASPPCCRGAGRYTNYVNELICTWPVAMLCGARRGARRCWVAPWRASSLSLVQKRAMFLAEKAS